MLLLSPFMSASFDKLVTDLRGEKLYHFPSSVSSPVHEDSVFLLSIVFEKGAKKVWMHLRQHSTSGAEWPCTCRCSFYNVIHPELDNNCAFSRALLSRTRLAVFCSDFAANWKWLEVSLWRKACDNLRLHVGCWVERCSTYSAMRLCGYGMDCNYEIEK